MTLWLQVLFNTVWSCEMIPSDWKTGLLAPVYKKKGSKAECNNYRGTNLLSVPDKLFFVLLLKREKSTSIPFVDTSKLGLC